MIIPYTIIDEQWTLPDAVLVVIYNRIMDSGVGDDLFFDGGVLCADDFIRDMKDGRNSVCFVAEGNDIVGGGWLNNIRENSAFGHFFALPQIWGRSSSVMREILDHWFNCPGLDVIIGEYPACHHRLEKFLLSLGFFFLGEIPHIKHGSKRVGSKIGYITREGCNG